MKLVCLNLWCGKVYKDTIRFLKREAKTTDIFCFQEVLGTKTKRTDFNGLKLNLFPDLISELSEFNGYLAPSQDKFVLLDDLVDFDMTFGLAAFVRKGFEARVNDFFVYGKRNGMVNGNKETLPRNVQEIKLKVNGKDLSVFNYHGIWRRGVGEQTNKSDTPERLRASEIIRKRVTNAKGEKIICGDFNLLPDTKSLAVLEYGMVNLIKKFGIQTTRSRLYKKDGLKFADYTIVSKGIKIKNFEVPNITVSDHLPMMLEFGL